MLLVVVSHQEGEETCFRSGMEKASTYGRDGFELYDHSQRISRHPNQPRSRNDTEVWASIIRTRIDLDGEKVATLGVEIDGGVTKLPGMGAIAWASSSLRTGGRRFVAATSQGRLTFSPRQNDSLAQRSIVPTLSTEQGP